MPSPRNNYLCFWLCRKTYTSPIAPFSNSLLVITLNWMQLQLTLIDYVLCLGLEHFNYSHQSVWQLPECAMFCELYRKDFDEFINIWVSFKLLSGLNFVDPRYKKSLLKIKFVRTLCMCFFQDSSTRSIEFHQIKQRFNCDHWLIAKKSNLLCEMDKN